MNTLEVILERDTANDEFAMIAAIFVESGASVVKDEPLFEIENSKATEEHVSPGTGILVHDLVVGQKVDFGVTIARVHPAAASVATERPAPEALPALPTTEAPAPLAPQQQSEQRFSKTAAALLQRYGLSASQFDADFVTSADVLAHVKCESQVLTTLAQALPAAQSTVATRAVIPPAMGRPVSQSKRAEIDALSNGAGQTMLSVLGVHLGRLQVRRPAGDFFESRITDLLLYESSRLMRKYPRLNAFYVDGQVVLHEAVHAGLAIDDGGRLVVYGLEDTDRAELPEIANGVADAVARYINGGLTAHELTRATFTVTDLSAGELDFVLPLLPRGQSCIVGVTSSTREGYRLFAGFDHRITEGREVMAFLGELRERLLSFSSPGCRVLSASVCGFCGRSVTEAVASSRDKGLLKVVGTDGEETLCCGSCWSGW